MIARIVHVQLVVRDYVLHLYWAARHPIPHHGEGGHSDFQVVTHSPMVSTIALYILRAERLT